jgi:hypothetical protein
VHVSCTNYERALNCRFSSNDNHPVRYICASELRFLLHREALKRLAQLLISRSFRVTTYSNSKSQIDNAWDLPAVQTDSNVIRSVVEGR